MAKDVNIHVKTPGAEKSERELNEVAAAGKRVGDKVAEGSNKAAEATDKSSKKLSGMGSILTTLKGQVTGLVGAWLGMEGVKKVVDYLIKNLEKIKEIQEKIYQNSLQLGEVGQGLEIQTGTVGEQEEWTKKVIEVQKAGGLRDAATAKEILVAMDIIFKSQGGIVNPEIMTLAKDLAPFFGTNLMRGEEASSIFKFAGTAGVELTPEAYKHFFAKLQAGYTSSKSTSPGDFITNLQKGGTAYLGQGGSLVEAIAAYASAISVTANENLAASLMTQVARFSSGGYEKPRMAVEASQGVKWEDLNMDQRMTAFLGYIAGLPENRRMQMMIEQGFEPGLASEVQKMVTPEAIETMKTTRRYVAQATPELTEQQMRAYIESNLGKARQLEAEVAAMEIEAGPNFAAWERRKQKAKARHEIMMVEGEDARHVLDAIEPYYIALREMMNEIEELQKTARPEDTEKLSDLHRQVKQSAGMLTGYHGLMLSPWANQIGYIHEQRLGELAQSVGNVNTGQQAGNPSQVVNINYHNETIYTPRVGSDDRGPRSGPELE